MRKSSRLLILIGLSLITLAACSSKETSQTSQSQATTTVTSQEQTTMKKTQAVLSGKLSEDVTSDKETFKFYLVEVEGIEDPEKIADSFGQEGVVLNASEANLPKDFKLADYLAGTKIKVTLEALPITTRSIPPQIPGGSIISIEKL